MQYFRKVVIIIAKNMEYLTLSMLTRQQYQLLFPIKMYSYRRVLQILRSYTTKHSVSVCTHENKCKRFQHGKG
jgi:hypothetical protein